MDQTAKREIAGEYSAEFDRLRQARVNVSFYKYGPARKNFGEGRVDALATAKKALEKYGGAKNGVFGISEGEN